MHRPDSSGSRGDLTRYAAASGFVVFYAFATLVTGTVAGLSRPSSDAAMCVLLAAVLLAAAVAPKGGRLDEAAALLVARTGPGQTSAGASRHAGTESAASGARLGTGFEATLVAWLALAFLSAAFAPCPVRSLHLAVQFAAAGALFYLLRGWDHAFCARAMALVATAAAGFGLGVYLAGYTPRVTAPFGQHHYAAGFFLLHLPLTARLARQRRIWAWAAALEAAAVVGTRSLAGVFVLALLGLWALLDLAKDREPLFTRRRLALLAVALALVALLAVSPLSVFPRVRSLLARGEDPSLSLENRWRYLRTGVAMLAPGSVGAGFSPARRGFATAGGPGRTKAGPYALLGTRLRPLLGWGLGSVPLVAACYRPQVPDVMPQGETLPHLHNLPLNLAAETGLLGLALAAWLFWRARSPAILAYAVFALFDYQLDLPAILFPLAAVAAVSYSPKLPETGDVKTTGSILRIVFLLAALAAPFQSLCGWKDFEQGSYVSAAARLPDLIPVSAAAGAELVDSGRAAQAIPYLERAVALDSYFSLAYYHLGWARAATGDRRGAVDAFSRALLVEPVTVFAEGWDPDLYRQSIRRALQDLSSLTAGVPLDRRSRRRHAELRAFLEANAAAPPRGPYRRIFAEITDADLAHNTSLLIFRRVGSPRYTSPVAVLLPELDFYLPPGIGYLRGLPVVTAARRGP